jgi:hypothetical protein
MGASRCLVKPCHEELAPMGRSYGTGCGQDQVLASSLIRPCPPQVTMRRCQTGCIAPCFVLGAKDISPLPRRSFPIRFLK